MSGRPLQFDLRKRSYDKDIEKSREAATVRSKALYDKDFKMIEETQVWKYNCNLLFNMNE